MQAGPTAVVKATFDRFPVQCMAAIQSTQRLCVGDPNCFVDLGVGVKTDHVAGWLLCFQPLKLKVRHRMQVVQIFMKVGRKEEAFLVFDSEAVALVVDASLAQQQYLPARL